MNSIILKYIKEGLNMHFLLCVWLIYLVWRRGVWRDWKKYHTTMLFFSFMELFYNSIVEAHDYYLWKIAPDLFLTRTTVVALYVFIIFPLSALLYLSSFPDTLKKQTVYIAKWCVIYIIVEWVGTITNRIEYYNGWKLWHSLIFDGILFWGLHYHYKRPFIAYILFILSTCLGVWIFKIPV